MPCNETTDTRTQQNAKHMKKASDYKLDKMRET